MGDSIKAYYEALAEHGRGERRQGAEALDALDNVSVDRISLGDLRLLLELTPNTHAERLAIKEFHEKYIGPLAWAPKADIR